MPLTVHQFVTKWKAAALTERSAYQQHFLDLCELLGVRPPAAEDPTGASFTFEKGVAKSDGGKGFADVWRRGCFGWEYKGKHKNLSEAYRQLQQYREALENPPLLIVCDLEKFVIHTNFTGTPTEAHAFHLDDLADPAKVALLHRAFHNPYEFQPGRTQKQVTEEVAGKFAALADGLRGRGVEPERAAHFLMKLMFCMFAEDIDLLPHDLFTTTVGNAKSDPARLSKFLAGLFANMATGGFFGPEEIAYFNGGLFADADVIDLTPAEIGQLHAAALSDWSAVEPSVFGTLFERCLNPEKRSQLGAHYTSAEDIAALIKPVMVAPLRREWDAVRAKADKFWELSKGKQKKSRKDRSLTPWEEFNKVIIDFLDRLSHTTVLDPACGSGNFLYVAIKELLTLEKEVLTYLGSHGATARFPLVRPNQLRGIEVNRYARELAQVVVWIGYLQWMKLNGFVAPNSPVLDAMETIENRDAVLDRTDPANPKEPAWPDAEFLVGNPPFLGGNKVRAELGDDYVKALFKVYGERLPNFSDLVCYWFEKARAKIEAGTVKRAGLIATQGIRGGANRTVLERIKQTGDIFFAVSDRDWLLDGATVHVSMVGFDAGDEDIRSLNGAATTTISPSLGGGTDLTRCKRLTENQNRCFMGASKKASFDIEEPLALRMLVEPNPDGRVNSDVVRPWANGIEITRRPQFKWIIDFGTDMSGENAALYDHPYAYVERVVKPERAGRREERIAAAWWRFGRPRVEMRRAIVHCKRYLVTPGVAKHRTFTWVSAEVVPDQQLLVFATEQDFDFGILHSRIHEAWARAPGMGTQVREAESGFRYTPTTCFETFPFPEPTPEQREAVAAAARELDGLRANWLNPPEWTATEVLTFPGSVNGPWRRFVHDPDGRGVGTVRYPRTVSRDGAAAAKLKQRTLTKLYNERPAWLANAHAKLDAAVSAAYGWADAPAGDELLARLLALNLARAGTAAPPPAADPEPDEG